MKIAILGARLLLGFMFFVFGLNNFLHFIPMPALPPSDAVTFSTILASHNYMTFIALLQVIAGLLLLDGRFVPLALTLLAPIIVNILLFHFLLAHEGAAGGLIAALLEIFLLFIYRRSFRPLFEPAPEIAPEFTRRPAHEPAK